MRLGATYNTFGYSAAIVQTIKSTYTANAPISVVNFRNVLGTALFGYNVTKSPTTFSRNIEDQYLNITSINGLNVANKVVLDVKKLSYIP